jgi:hypothetical protein
LSAHDILFFPRRLFVSATKKEGKIKSSSFLRAAAAAAAAAAFAFAMPFSVSVRERCMYSHSLRFGDGEAFRTGCTAVVDATFGGDSLSTPDGVLIDITVAQAALRQVLLR